MSTIVLLPSAPTSINNNYLYYYDFYLLPQSYAVRLQNPERDITAYVPQSSSYSSSSSSSSSSLLSLSLGGSMDYHAVTRMLMDVIELFIQGTLSANDPSDSEGGGRVIDWVKKANDTLPAAFAKLFDGDVRSTSNNRFTTAHTKTHLSN